MSWPFGARVANGWLLEDTTELWTLGTIFSDAIKVF